MRTNLGLKVQLSTMFFCSTSKIRNVWSLMKGHLFIRLTSLFPFDVMEGSQGQEAGYTLYKFLLVYNISKRKKMHDHSYGDNLELQVNQTCRFLV